MISPWHPSCSIFLLLSWLSLAESQKVAIIGGGLSGTFTSKYLVDLDGKGCNLDSITIFDPLPIGGPAPTSDDDWQGSRVSSVALPDGRIVELGASVFHEANQLVKDMIDNDPALEIGTPFNVGNDATIQHHVPPREGLGIYDGDGAWAYMGNKSDPWNTVKTVLRYNMDLYRVDRATQHALESFLEIPALLNSTAPDTFFESPDDMWQRVQLLKPTHASYSQLLDAMGIWAEDSWFHSLIPHGGYLGSLRRELLTAINLINYNQPNSHINGLVGLVSFAASKGPLYSVVGGNQQMIRSAFSQAQTNRRQNCQQGDGLNVVTHVAQRVTTVIGSMDGFELFAGQEVLGTFDAVVLAAPLQQCRIQFLIPSQFDSAVLQPMPLANAMVDTDKAESQKDHEGHPVLPDKLPDCSRRPFTQVVTTVVSGATLNHEHFHIDKDKLPRAVCVTERGKEKEGGITVISEIAGDGVYKMFSSNVLSEDTLKGLFGPGHTVEFVKTWGGPHGGATPDYQGQGVSVGYLLYDGATGLEGHTKNGALYYPNAIETALACMEASAIGAKSVAKLLARRFGIIQPSSRKSHNGEEL
ncbi:Prenylcysteine lyase [Seminavis robusta]|uniref:Prenylcysteine lyase n=1 Tax=Seminavis robusta TaxID=568900 RepID=A0A9N8DZ74_9STRA|nr:Prenylcysteine lyase [Seminavis robusta]|eukprot:Sro358_g125810.1 Prenylcysteine lyase (584) ;mRNA; f:18607-20557